MSSVREGVELVGYLKAAVGVGEAARRYVEALRAVDVPVVEHDIPLEGRDLAGGSRTSAPAHAPDRIGFSILCLNPEQMVPYLHGDMGAVLPRRNMVGIWSWEVDVIPEGWRAAAELVTEVWTYSRFAAELIQPAVDVPVFAVPPPISPPSARPVCPPQLPEGFRVLVMFDYLSTLERKNPLGAIRAFREAFDHNDRAVLVLKSMNGRHRPLQRDELQAAAAGRSDIVVIDRTMSAAERDGLVAGCDCLLSLHRSEGHGLALAEAMVAGKPVVATAYGGNTEFMTDENSYPVRWSPSPVGPGVEHYPAGARWAEPDIVHAARLLRAVREDREDAGVRAERGRADVTSLLSRQAVGAAMRTRLESLQREGIDDSGTSLRRGNVLKAAAKAWRPRSGGPEGGS